MTPEPRSRTLLPHALAALYGLAVVYASLQPFAPWISPAPGTPFWPFAPWPLRSTRFDFIANIVAYMPLGLFVALMPHRASPADRVGVAFAAAATLAFMLETVQMFLPPRDANLLDFLANSAGGLAGGVLGSTLVHAHSLRQTLSNARSRVFLEGRLGDVGIALLVIWLAAQLNPGISLFAVTFDPTPVQAVPAALFAIDSDRAGVLLEAAQSALQLVGVGLFLTLLLRQRRYVIGAILWLLGLALVSKGIAAALMLKPAAQETWLKPGVAIGIVVGALALLPAVYLRRPAQVAACATALLASLLLPFLSSDLFTAHAPLTLFNWRYGHLLNFNGLTHTVLLAWPIAAALWLFALAGRPEWGRPH
ncbi:MAG: VanZ family protein [Casimicrobiaceae bacterium]